MADPFDPYRKWLGIPPEEQPPNHYRLLGIGLFEADADVIQEAADRQMAHVQRHKLGQFGPLSQKLLNELAAANICLLAPARKAQYDRQLRAKLAPKSPPAADADAAPAPKARSRPAPAPAPVAQPEPAPAAASDDFGIGELAAPAKSRVRKATGKRKKSSVNPLLIGGAVVGGMALVIIVGLIASRDNQPAAVAHKPAEGSKPDSPTAKKQPPEPKKSTEPVATPAAPAEPESTTDPVPAQKLATDIPGEPPSGDEPDSTALASADVTELLPLVKVSAKAADGKWRKSDKGLMLLASDSPFPRVVLPYAPPNEYQLEMLIEPQPGAELILGLLAGESQFAAILNGWGGSTSGLQLVDSKAGNENASTHLGPVFIAGRPNRVLATVRDDSVKITCDGLSIIDWHGSRDHLTLAPAQSVPDRRALFVGGGNGTAYQIRSLRLATISGKGQELTAPAVDKTPLARVEAPVEGEPADAEKPKPRPLGDDGFAFPGHTGDILSIVVTPDSKCAISGGLYNRDYNQSLRRWDLTEMKPLETLSVLLSDHYGLALSPDGKILYAADLLQSVHSIEITLPGQGMYSYTSQMTTPPGTIAVAASNDGKLVAAAGLEGISAWHVKTPPTDDHSWCRWSDPDVPAYLAVGLLPNTRMLGSCAGIVDPSMKSFDANQNYRLLYWSDMKKPPRTIDGHHGGVWGIAVSRDGTKAATASEDQTVRIWDTKSMSTMQVLRGHDGRVMTVALSTDGKYALSGGVDKSVRLWDTESGKQLKRFDKHTDIVRAVAITPDGRYGLSGGNDKIVRVWQLDLPGQPASPAKSKKSTPAGKPAQASDKRVPVPAEEDLAAAVKLVRETFADDYKQAKKPADKVALAEKLLVQSGESQNETERYALLGEARTLAGAGGSPVLGIQLIEEIGTWFDIDVAQQTVEFVEQNSKDSLPSSVRKELAEAMLPLADAAIARSDFDIARRLLAVAVQSARKTNDTALVKQMSARMAEVSESKKAFDAYRKALATLELSPGNPEAQLAAGKYLCFVKHDWTQGFEYLSKSGDEALKEVAELELHPPTNPDDQVKLGDLWWKLIEQTKGKAKADYAERADKWYGTALPGLKGLMQTKVSKRMEELATMHKGSSHASTIASSTPATGAARPAAEGSAGEGATIPSKPLVAKIRQAVKKDALIRTPLTGRAGTAFADMAPLGAVLAGFNFTLEPNENSARINSIQPVYWGSKGAINGVNCGNNVGTAEKILAKNGYAVAGIHLSTGVYMFGFEVVFAKLGPTGLDMSDKYTSQWYGARWNPPSTLGDNGQMIVGIFGAGNPFGVTGFGLVQVPDK